MNDILLKIKKDIFDRSQKENFKELSRMGHATHEYDYRYCTSPVPGLEDFYLVVSKILKYHNSALDDFHYKVYLYDKEGNFVEDPAAKEKCKGDFFHTLIDIV